MSEMNATPATEAATSETQDFLSSVGESEKRVRVSGRAVSDEVVLSTKDVNVYYGDHRALRDTSLDFHKGEITALIGVNLAVFNLLPIPALDGSKVVFTIIEWIRGKPVNRKVEAVIHTVGFLFLIGFAILVDILQLF